MRRHSDTLRAANAAMKEGANGEKTWAYMKGIRAA